MDAKDYEVIVINTPLPDEFGHELGTDAVTQDRRGRHPAGQDRHRRADRRQIAGVRRAGAGQTVHRRSQFRQAVQLAASNYKRLAVLRAENAKLLDKIAQLRLVDRAKCYLIEKKGTTPRPRPTV